MQRVIRTGWLVLAVLALLVAVYVTVDEGFVFGKAYMFVLLGGVCAFMYRYQSKS